MALPFLWTADTAREVTAMAEETKLRVRIDREKCQGHARCFALAPELFELDEMGNGRERGDGTVAPELEDKAYLARANCPEVAIEVVEEDAPRAGLDGCATGPPISTTATRAGSRTPIRSGTNCAAPARLRTPSGSRAPISRAAMPTLRRSPTTPSTFPRAALSC